MSRTANPARTVHIRISTTPRVKLYLERLVSEGTFGKNVGEAAERLISMKLNEMLGPQRYSHVLTNDNSIPQTDDGGS